MATEFALTRFLPPVLGNYAGWSLFCDCDFLFLADVAELLDFCDEDLALLCVQHEHRPVETVKMDGQAQTSYPRKNWSSFVLWNNAHLAHAGQLERVQRWPGLWLHQFRWLQPEQIGALHVRWNWLEGISDPAIKPAAVHFTRGVPSMPGYERAAYAGLWRSELSLAGMAA